MNMKSAESRFNAKDKINLLNQSKLTSAITLICIIVSTILNLDKFTRNSKIKNLIKLHESARHNPSNQCNESRESRVPNELKQSSKHLIIRINQKNLGNLMSTKNLINLKNYKTQNACSMQSI